MRFPFRPFPSLCPQLCIFLLSFRFEGSGWLTSCDVGYCVDFYSLVYWVWIIMNDRDLSTYLILCDNV